MRQMTVYTCVRILAETFGMLPVSVHKYRKNGKGNDRINDHPLADLLGNTPNAEMTSAAWREALIGSMALSGNGYSVITRTNGGNVYEIYPVEWQNVLPYRDPNTQKIMYQINDRGKSEILPADRVFHVPGMGFNGIIGFSPVRMAANSIGVSLATADFVERFYAQGMNIGGVLEHPEALSDTAYKRLQAWIDEKGIGMANSWRPLILEEGMKYSRIPMPLADAQFIETKKLSRDEICGLFRVPPHMVGNLDRATFSNIEHQGIEFVKYALMPYITKFEQTANWKLLTPKERAEGYYVKVNANALMRGDYKSRQEGLAIQRQNGTISADEWRELEDMNPIEDGTGSEYLVNSAMQPVKKLLSTEGGE